MAQIFFFKPGSTRVLLLHCELSSSLLMRLEWAQWLSAGLLRGGLSPSPTTWAFPFTHLQLLTLSSWKLLSPECAPGRFKQKLLLPCLQGHIHSLLLSRRVDTWGIINPQVGRNSAPYCEGTSKTVVTFWISTDLLYMNVSLLDWIHFYLGLFAMWTHVLNEFLDLKLILFFTGHSIICLWFQHMGSVVKKMEILKVVPV